VSRKRFEVVAKRGPEAALALVLAGVLAHFGLLRWFGRLPGDLRYETGSTRVYVPITSMLVVSLAISGVAWLVRRLS
jgi:hypothetical protein